MGFPRKGYKARNAASRPAAEQRRLEILAASERDGRSWLNLDLVPDVRQRRIACDHALDTFRVGAGYLRCRAEVDDAAAFRSARAGAGRTLDSPRPGSFADLAP
jgi:hypothetical protein